jgi:hypothetical protein
MPDEVFIYLIVALNALVQLMLIRQLKFPPGGRRKFYLSAVAIPVFIMLSTRLLIASGVIHSRVADQSAAEHMFTGAASILLMAGPWFVTLFAILDRRRRAWVKKLRAESDEPV